MDIIVDRTFEQPNEKFNEDVEKNCKLLAELTYSFHARLFNIDRKYSDLSDQEQEKWASIGMLVRCCDDLKYSLDQILKSE